jgi:two-component system sensor histidine kinase BaeS
MLRTLRDQLIISHLLPLLIILPLAGIAFVYVLETRVILPGLADELVTETKLIAELAGEQPSMWQDQTSLEALISRLAPQTNARLMFLDSEGVLLASSDPTDENLIGKVMSNENTLNVQKGNIIQHIDDSRKLNAEVIDVCSPVYSQDKRLIGMIRMSYPFMSISEELLQLRYIILGIMTFALVVGVILGSTLAITISTPIRQVTKAIDGLANGDRTENLEVKGPEEIQSLAKSTNFLFERLHDLERARKQLLANLVHELGRPLGALHSAIQSLKMVAGNDPQVLDDLTNGMDAETVRLQHLLDDLAHMYNQIFGSLELDRQVITPQSWIATLLRPWQEAAHEKGLKWRLEIPDTLPVFRADPFRIAQTIENLVSNAIKYTPKGGTVTITVGCDDEIFWIKVRDTGPGIAPEQQEKIFEPFYRGDQIKRIKQGMGLGLSIARDLIKAHRGDILLDSSLGEGSTFTIWLPLT